MEKVFGIGLSRTGTKSLAGALSLLGYNAAHYVYRNGVLDTEAIYGDEFNALTDTPIAFRMEELYYSFPDAKFIYTDRDMDSWKRSVTTHFKCSSPDQIAKTSDTLLNAIIQNLYWNYNTWEGACEAHSHRVERLFRHSGNRLLKLEISDSNKWEKLCSFLDKPIPTSSYPHFNRVY